MNRKTISEQELVELLNREISNTPEVDKCRISGIYKLKKRADENRCNWSVVYFSTPPSTPMAEAETRIRQIVARMQPLYNVL